MNPSIKPGDKIRIIRMCGKLEYTGKEGIIDHIDDAGQLHGSWGGLALIPDADQYEVVNE